MPKTITQEMVDKLIENAKKAKAALAKMPQDQSTNILENTKEGTNNITTAQLATLFDSYLKDYEEKNKKFASFYNIRIETDEIREEDPTLEDEQTVDLVENWFRDLNTLCKSYNNFLNEEKVKKQSDSSITHAKQSKMHGSSDDVSSDRTEQASPAPTQDIGPYSDNDSSSEQNISTNYPSINELKNEYKNNGGSIVARMQIFGLVNKKTREEVVDAMRKRAESKDSNVASASAKTIKKFKL